MRHNYKRYLDLAIILSSVIFFSLCMYFRINVYGVFFGIIVIVFLIIVVDIVYYRRN